MIAPADFCQQLASQGLGFFCGVPDSLLKSFCAYIDESFGSDEHVITANEGNAIALASGYYLGCGRPAVVYMQNSGLGNAVNPITSLASKEVYGIPMLLLIGWRGEPDVKDEPQHAKQGEITPDQLQLLDVPYIVLDASGEALSRLPDLLTQMQEECRPVAALVRKGTFSAFSVEREAEGIGGGLPKREDAVETLLELLDPETIIVSTTGKSSRELFELREKRQEAHRDFLTVGAMGHTASIGFGVAMAQPNRDVAILDGDGAALMHMGAMAVMAAKSKADSRVLHVLLNNGCHESVGGQPTVANELDFKSIAAGFGYRHCLVVSSLDELARQWPAIEGWQGLGLLEIKTERGSRSDLGRPYTSPKENKASFMKHAMKQ